MNTPSKIANTFLQYVSRKAGYEIRIGGGLPRAAGLNILRLPRSIDSTQDRCARNDIAVKVGD